MINVVLIMQNYVWIFTSAFSHKNGHSISFNEWIGNRPRIVSCALPLELLSYATKISFQGFSYILLFWGFFFFVIIVRILFSGTGN
jgi:hypothetical protein